MTEHFDWIDMMEHMQEIRLFAGHHIRGKREGATSPQEVDMLSRIYLAGNQELQQAYRHYLEPIYRLRRTLGEERFHTLLSQIREANHLLQNTAADK